MNDRLAEKVPLKEGAAEVAVALILFLRFNLLGQKDCALEQLGFAFNVLFDLFRRAHAHIKFDDADIGQKIVPCIAEFEIVQGDTKTVLIKLFYGLKQAWRGFSRFEYFHNHAIFGQGLRHALY